MPPDTPAVTPADLAAAEAIAEYYAGCINGAVTAGLTNDIAAALSRRADEARREGVAEGLARAVELIRQEQDKPMLTPTSDLLERIARRLILQPKSVDRLIERMQSDDLVDADGNALPQRRIPVSEPTEADRAVTLRALRTCEREHGMRLTGLHNPVHECIATALALARREGREAGRREAAEHCIGTLRAAADKARQLSRANDGSREGDACAWTADTLAELADRLAALPPPGEGGK